MGVVLDLWTVAKDLFGLRQEFKAASRERRHEIAEFFSSISQCLGAVYEQLMSDEVPHGRCAELATYADTQPKVVSGVINPDRAKALAENLRRAHNVESLMMERGGDPQGLANLPKLAEASGIFAALAASVKAGL
jgi:hypothetical protein